MANGRTRKRLTSDMGVRRDRGGIRALCLHFSFKFTRFVYKAVVYVKPYGHNQLNLSRETPRDVNTVGMHEMHAGTV